MWWVDESVLVTSVGIEYVGSYILFFFFNDTATTEIYTLSLHDALPIYYYYYYYHHHQYPYGPSGHLVGAITTTTTNTHMVIEALGGCGLHS